MKRFFFTTFLFIFLFGFNHLMAQKYASTVPCNKYAIMELFSAVRDSYSPKGDAVSNYVANKYPGKVFIVTYHPSNNSYTTPYGGDESLKRDWPTAFFTKDFAGNVDLSPIAFINRRKKDGLRVLTRESWSSKALEISKEQSPCNVGLHGTYDPEGKTLTVDVEVYFTADVTDKCHIYAVLVQDSVVARQATFADDNEKYAHNKVFREGLTGAWGDPITESTAKNSLVTRKYVFDNTAMNYKIEKCSVLVFIRNETNEEIITGMGSKAHSDRLIIDNLVVFDISGTGVTKEQVFNIKNIDESTVSVQLMLTKSARTPADWTVDCIVPSSAFKKQDSPQNGIININPGKSVDITVKLVTGQTVGVGDAILSIAAPDLFNENKSIQFTIVSDSIENLEIIKNPNGKEPNSLNMIIKSTGRDELIKLEPKAICTLYNKLNKLKLISWSFNPCDTLHEEYADAIYSMMKKGVRVLITGSYPLTSLFEVYAGHPLFSLLGVTIDEGSSHKDQGDSYTFVSEKTDKKFGGLSLPWKLNTKTDSLIQPLIIKKPTVATPVLKIKDLNTVVAVKASTKESRAIVLHFNPYSLTTSANRQALLGKCFDWLEAAASVGPGMTLNFDEMAFGEVNAGKFANLELEVTNSGDETLVLRKFVITGKDKDYFRVQMGGITDSISIEPGFKDTVSLRFTVPASLYNSRDYEAVFEITSNIVEDSIKKINLKGRGIGGNGIQDIDEQILGFEVKPNPASVQAVIEFNFAGPGESFVEAVLSDISGRTVKNIYCDLLQPGLTSINFNTEGIPAGIYFLSIKSIYGSRSSKVIIKK